MKIIEKKVNDTPFAYAPFDTFFGEHKCGVFDIETTGLSPKTCQLILSGFYLPLPNGEFVYKQFFAEDLDEEPLVILETLKVLNELDYIVTFNGASFDMNFLLKRMKTLGIPICPMPYNLDLYKIIRNFSDIKKFTPNLKQKTIEAFMGLSSTREDEIDGAASVYEYFDFLESRDPAALEKILLHNRDDVLQLYKILGILNKTDFFKAMCLNGFPIKNYTISSIKLSKQKLKINGVYDGHCSYSRFEDEKGFTYDFACETGEFTLLLNLQTIGKLTFADLNILNLKSDTLVNSEGYSEDNLVLANDGTVNYQGVSLLTKVFTERIIENEL